MEILAADSSGNLKIDVYKRQQLHSGKPQPLGTYFPVFQYALAFVQGRSVATDSPNCEWLWLVVSPKFRKFDRRAHEIARKFIEHPLELFRQRKGVRDRSRKA